ncbi:MAG TPA: T9SS type A sorting domain-containing protein, partial [Bacteroidia bacterium]|nr:T9SS type A sorting domain-containing protein [Bacteroidia bacterium]
FSGALTTPLNWQDWQESGGVHHRGNFTALANYIANSSIDFNQQLTPVVITKTPVDGADFYNFYLQDDGVNNAWGWVQNAEHYWQSDNTNSYYTSDTTITHHCPAANITCLSVGGYETIEFDDFNTWTKYQIDYYSTSTGAYIGQDENTLYLGTTLRYKRDFDCAGNADVAYKVHNIGGARLADDTAKLVTNPTDTIYVNQNPYCVSAVGGIDNYLNYSYYWNYGNGHTSTDTTTCITYGVGTYTLQLNYVNDAGDTARNISQTLVVLDTAGTITGRVAAAPPTTYAGSAVYSPVNHAIKVYPNPAQNTLYITNEAGTEIKDCQLIDMLGNVFNCTLQSNNTINISNLAPGSYYLHLNTVSGASIFKIIKTD